MDEGLAGSGRNRQAPSSPSGSMGNDGGENIRASRSRGEAPSCAGTCRSTRASSWSTARQNGRPSTWSQCRWLSRIDPRNGSEPISAERERIPVPASISRVGAAAPSARTATHDV